LIFFFSFFIIILHTVSKLRQLDIKLFPFLLANPICRGVVGLKSHASNNSPNFVSSEEGGGFKRLLPS